MHTKQSRSNKQHQHPSHSLQGQCQHLLTYYFVHEHKMNWAKQTTSAPIIFIARAIINIYLLPKLWMYTRWVRSKKSTSAFIIFTVRATSISTYLLFCTCTQNEMGQTSNVSINYIHCKGHINIYLQAILCMHTEQVRSNKQHQHPPYSLQGQYQYLLTSYFLHAHKMR